MLTDPRPCNLLQDLEDVRHTARLGLTEPFAIARCEPCFLRRRMWLLPLLPFMKTAAAYDSSERSQAHLGWVCMQSLTA